MPRYRVDLAIWKPRLKKLDYLDQIEWTDSA